MDWKELSLTTASLDFLAGHPLVYHCHHFNLFLDQTVDDFYGAERGIEIRTQAAREAGKHLLDALFLQRGVRVPPERIELAQKLFRDFGHGRLFVYGDETRGEAEGEFLHYGFVWKQKYGQFVKRTTPADAFAAGFAAAALQTAYGVESHFAVRESECVALSAPRCRFELRADPELRSTSVQVDLEVVESTQKPLFGGLEEERIVAIEEGLRAFLAGVAGDERGLVEAFGVFVTRHTTNYYNGISYRMLADLERETPFLKKAAEALLRESGHVCVFNTFGGILYSPEWEASFGRIEGDPLEIVSACMAIARALGFGHWTIADLSEKLLVIRAPTEYESPFCFVNDWAPKEGNSYFLQGAALAIMRLWEAIDWRERPPLDQKLYTKLFKSEHPWRVEQTKSLAAGDPYSEVVVTR